MSISNSSMLLDNTIIEDSNSFNNSSEYSNSINSNISSSTLSFPYNSKKYSL